jgi:hypothetical protein
VRIPPANVSFALALIAECVRQGDVPPVELAFWLVDAAAAAVDNGTTIDYELGMTGKSTIRNSRTLARNSAILQAASMIEGSDRQIAAEISERMKRLSKYDPSIQERRILDEADGLVLSAMQRGFSGGEEAIRKILRGRCQGD